MGMYNEVFDTCPKCGNRTGYLQVYQIVLGFGGFDISDLSGLKSRFDSGDLSAKDLTRLADALEDEVFYCSDRSGEARDDCHSSWRPDPAKIMAIRMLPKVGQGDTEARAIQLLKDAGIIQS